MADVNPRQFASLDASEAGLHGSLTNRPPSSTSVGDPIDFEAINRQVINDRTQPGYVYKESTVESTLRKQKDIAASLRIKQETADAKAANALQLQHEQAQRNALKNRISDSPISPEVGQPTPESPLEAPPRSTPERQPAPSTGRPPATPNGTATRASALVEPTATPPPAIPAERIPPPSSGGVFEGLPRSLPQAAGRFVIPGAFAVGDFAVRVVQGQPVTQAASGAVASTAGAFAGALVGTAIAGPVGEVVGAMIGGYIGGAGSDYFFHSPPSAGSPPVEAPNYPPFRGGQAPAVAYKVTGTYDIYGLFGDFVHPQTFTDSGAVTGPIGSISLINNDQNGHGFAVQAINHLTGQPKTEYFTRGGPSGSYSANLRDISVVRVDGKDDYYPDLTAPAPPPDGKPYYLEGTFPLNEDNTIPSGKPAAGLNKGKNRDVLPGIPANNTPNSTGAYFPGHGGLAPTYLPNPEHQPSNLGAMLPQQEPQQQMRQFLPFAEPKNLPVARVTPTPESLKSSHFGLTVTPGENGFAVVTPATITQSEFHLAEVTKSTGGFGEYTDSEGNYHPAGEMPPGQKPSIETSPNTRPASVPSFVPGVPVSDAQSKVPKVKTLPSIKNPEEVATEKSNQTIEQQKKDFDEQIIRLTTIAGLIAGLTPIIQGIPDAIAKSPTVQTANRATTQGAVCEIAQPGGCLGDALDNSADKINQNNNKNTNSLLDKISAGSNAAQLALLNIINNKLGDQVPGGLSKFMENIAKNTYVEKALTFLTFVISLHNGLMLSSNLAQTLGATINAALGLVLPKGLDGTPIDINQVLGKAAHEIIADTIGEANYTKLTEDWAKANRIYQASANVLNSLTNFSATIMSGLEVVGGTLGKVGNALKKWGVVGEKAYEWFNPQPNFHNKAFVFLENANNEANTIQNIVNVPVSIGQAKTDLESSVTELQTSIKGDKNPGIAIEENKPKKDEFDLGKSISKSLDIAVDDIFNAND